MSSRDVLGHGLAFHRPVIARLVRVDNWFGQRWLGFSGKVLGAFGVGKSRACHSTVRAIPNRFREFVADERSPCGCGRRNTNPCHKRMPSAENLERFFDLHCPETLAVWFSSRSLHNGRGAIYGLFHGGRSAHRVVVWGNSRCPPAGDWSLRVLKGLTPCGLCVPLPRPFLPRNPPHQFRRFFK